MDRTSISLLDRAVDDPRSDAWRQLCDLYAPLLRSWVERYSVQPSDADDLVQEVLVTMVRELPAFEHNGRAGAFRKWLRTILAHRLQNFWRAKKYRAVTGQEDLQAKLDELADERSAASIAWDREHDQYILARLIEAVRPRFQPATWQAFERHVIDARPAETVASELEIPVAHVYIAKSRVLGALRQQAAGLVDSL